MAEDVAAKRAGENAANRIDQELTAFDKKPFVSRADQVKGNYNQYKAEELAKIQNNTPGMSPEVATKRAGEQATKRVEKELADLHTSTVVKQTEGAAKNLANAERSGGRVLEVAGEAGSKALRGLGKIAVPLALTVDAIDLGSSIKADADRSDGSHIETKKAVGRIGGGWGGAAAGAVAGQLLIPIPVVGAVVGGIAGGIGGSMFGEWAAKHF
jgi:hypothetical protein